MLRILLLRGALVALPFALWFAWRWWARRTGREMGATPWPWLLAAGLALMGLSLMATTVFHRDTRGEVYVPGEAGADGKVTPGRFEEPAPRP